MRVSGEAPYFSRIPRLKGQLAQDKRHDLHRAFEISSLKSKISNLESEISNLKSALFRLPPYRRMIIPPCGNCRLVSAERAGMGVLTCWGRCTLRTAGVG
jgi:hypothetical protein